MSSQEKFNLRWNDFEANVSGAFEELRQEKDFLDVTLACEDAQVEAHKVILSACSPFFKNLLRRHHHQHPLLYLKGIRHSEMLSVINFMYCGEVSIAQEDLNSFLAVAEDLQIKGLTQNNSNQSRTTEPLPKRQKTHNSESQQVRPRHSQPQPHQRRKLEPEPTNDDVQEIVPIKSEIVPEEADNTHVAVYDEGGYTEYDESYQHYDDQQYADTTLVNEGNKALEELLAENMMKVPGGWQCRLCSKVDTKSHIVEHLESAHLEGVEYDCQFCDVKKHSRQSLRKHVQYAHK